MTAERYVDVIASDDCPLGLGKRPHGRQIFNLHGSHFYLCSYQVSRLLRSFILLLIILFRSIPFSYFLSIELTANPCVAEHTQPL
jgi:hypothetical protein